MAITSYTTYDDIRAALGVSDDELEDPTLSLSLYEDNLDVEFDDIDFTLKSTFATVSALTSRSDVEERFLQATRLFATYAVAYQLTGSLPLFSPKDIGDGKALVSRYADSPYRAVTDKVKEAYSRARARLEKAFADLGAASAPTYTPPPLMGVASGSRDPVTNS